MASTLQTPEEFGLLPISGTGDEVVRLHDVAQIELAAENTDMVVTFDGQPGTFIGVFPSPSANPLAWPLNDGRISCGMAAVVRLEGERASFRLLRHPCR